MSRSVFYGFGAFVGKITGPTTCGWWWDDPAKLGWADGALISIDLARSPSAVHGGRIEARDVVVDDFAGYGHGGLTKIGPMWPGGTMSGAIYIEKTFYDAMPAPPPRLPPDAQCRDYELCSVLYYSGPLAKRRFHGLYAEILGSQGNLAHVKVWQPGSSMAHVDPIGTYWVDLAQIAHPIEPGLTEVGIGATDAKQGALFVDASAKKVIPFDPPKTPHWLGGASERRRRVVR